MAAFKPFRYIDTPRVTAKFTEETLQWKKLAAPVTVKDIGLIHNVDIMSEEPFSFAVTCSSRVKIFDSYTNEVSSKLQEFYSAAYGAKFRADNNLIVAGSDEGIVKLFDISSSNVLRRFCGHKAPTQRVAFVHGTQIASFSDDCTVALWDISTEARVISIEAHNDYIRAGTSCPATPDIVLTGSYDNTSRLIDLRSGKTVLKVNHGCPVESVLMLPTGGLFMTAGGTTIRVWDVAAGKMIAQMAPHHKTITCLALARNNQRLLSGSLDRHVKVFDISSYKMVHTMNYPSPVLSMAIARDDSLFVVGSTTGLISIQRRKAEKIVNNHTSIAGYKRKVTKAISKMDLNENDVVIDTLRLHVKQTLTNHIRKFEYHLAIRKALEISKAKRQPEVLASVIGLIMKQRVLPNSVNRLHPSEQAELVRYASNQVSSFKYGRRYMDICSALVDILQKKVTSDTVLYNQFELMLDKLNKELEGQRVMMELKGCVEQILGNTSAERTAVEDLQRAELRAQKANT